MASYHCTVRVGGKGHAGVHAEYIMREGKYAPEHTKGKSRLEDMEHTTSGNMPAWAEHDAGVFWKAADEHERANGATYREIEIALPRELTPDQRRALVEDFISQQIGHRHPFTYAIHIPQAAIEKGEQPHAHIMYSERTLDGIARDPDHFFKRANSKNPEKGGCKKDSAGTKERLLATRELWAEVQNQHLEKAGFDERVSHLSLKARGIDRQPEKHLGPADAKKIDAPALLEYRAASRELDHARKELAVIDIAAELAEAAALAAAKVQADAEREAAALAAAQAQADREAAEINSKLTAEKEEKENDRIRAAAFESIGNNVKAAGKDSERCGRLDGFIKSDHADIEKADGAIGRDAEAGARVLLAAREHLRTGIRLADSNGANLGRAIEGTRRRVARSHLESCAAAFAKQLGRVDKVLQQAGRLFTGVVSTLATAAKEVIQRGIELNLDRIHKVEEAEFQKALQAEQAAKTIPTVQVSRFDKTGLWRSDDLDLVNRAKELFAQPKPDGYARYMLSQDLSKAMSAAVREIRDTEPRHASADAERTIKAEQNADARRAGQQEPWKAEQTACAWDTIAFRLDRERKQHLETKRPTGMFSGAAAKEYDTKTAGLTSQINNITRATAVLKAQLVEKVAEQARQQAQKGPQHAAAQERHAGLSLLHKAVAEATRQIDAQQEKTHDRGMGGMDYGR